MAGNVALAGLAVDTVFFLLLTGLAAGPLWLYSILFLFLIGSAVSAFHLKEVLFVAAVPLLFLTAMPKPHLDGLENTIMALGLFASAASMRLRHHESAITALNRKAADWRDAEARARDLERQKIAGRELIPIDIRIAAANRASGWREVLDRSPARLPRVRKRPPHAPGGARGPSTAQSPPDSC